jgi:RNA polymerase sigma-70 factor (ECF subfamily)
MHVRREYITVAVLNGSAAQRLSERSNLNATVTKNFELEPALLKRLRKGSRRAFEEVVNLYARRAYAVALGLVGNREDALELSQEAFYRAFKNIGMLGSGRQFFPWFYQILRNLCFTHLRRRRLRTSVALPQGDQQDFAPAEGDQFRPEAVAEANEAKVRVSKAIGKLSDKHREIIILRHFQNLSYEDIAKSLFCNKGTVMSRLYNARKNLKDILEREKGGLCDEL